MLQSRVHIVVVREIRAKIGLGQRCVESIRIRVLHVFNTWLPHGKKHCCYVYGNHHLIESVVILCTLVICSTLGYLNYYVGQERRDYALNLIVCSVWGSKK